MDFKGLSGELSMMQRRAFFKIAVDLVKIDNQIHRSEIALLNELQVACGIDSDELDMIHYLSLSSAVSVLSMLSGELRSALLEVLESIIGVDNDIDTRENLLMGSLRLLLGEESCRWGRVVSSVDVDNECSSKQIIYLESSDCQAAHEVLDDPYDNLLMTKALNDAGLQLFYLPNVIRDLGQQAREGNDTIYNFDLLRRSIEFLVPAGDHSKLSNLSSVLGGLNCSTFYKVVSSHYKIYPDAIPFSSFLMVKVHEGYILDDDNVLRRSSDFLIIDVSSEIKRRVLYFVDILEHPVSQLSYEGYYRLLYDYLSSESKIMSSILLDDSYDFRLSDLDNRKVVFESSPQSKSFYLLLLFYGQQGVSQTLFEGALQLLKSDEVLRFIGEYNLDIIGLKYYLMKRGDEESVLLYNLITIYTKLSSKMPTAKNFLKYIESILKHRSSLKNYINNGFAAVPGLANSEQYMVKFDRESRLYYLTIKEQFFNVMHGASEVATPLSQSKLWSRLR